MLLLAVPGAYCHESIHEHEALLSRLDSMIDNSASYLRAKETRLREVKLRLSHAADSTDSYNILRQLYDEYYTYDSDSAIYYARRARALAVRLGVKDAWAEWSIKMAYVYSACGLYAEALQEVGLFNGPVLPPGLRAEYYNTMEYIYSHYRLYVNDDSTMEARYGAKADQFKDSLGLVIGDGHPYYLWYAASEAGKATPRPLLQRLQAVVDNSRLDTRADAINSYWAAKVNEEQSRPADYLRYMIYSSMADVRIVNRDIASLEELAKFLFNHGDITRAYRYINYCLDQAHLYHNRVRMVSISVYQDSIRRAYLAQLNETDAKVRTMLSVAIVLLALLLGLMLFMVRQYRTLRRNKAELATLNASLEEHVKSLNAAHVELSESHEVQKRLNDELVAANRELQESNAIKEAYVGYAFTLSTDYINDLDDLRKKLLRKAKAQKINELVELLASEDVVQGELQRFYRSFDEAFMHIFPNFLEEYNAEQEPGDRVVLKEGELLSTKLRIYALHRLGITDSGRIAKMLRCSIQTVYNNKPRRRR